MHLFFGHIMATNHVLKTAFALSCEFASQTSLGYAKVPVSHFSSAKRSQAGPILLQPAEPV